MSCSQSQIFRGVVVGWAAHVCGMLVTFITTPLLIRSLGDEQYGTWAIIMSLAGYYALADFGLGKASAKYIAQYAATNDQEKIRKILASTHQCYLVLAFVILFVVVVTSFLFPIILHLDYSETASVTLVVLINGLRMVAQLFGTTFRSALIAYRRFDVTNMLAILTQILTAIGIILILKCGGGLLAMSVAVFAIGSAHELATWLIAKRLLGLPAFSLRDATPATRKMMFNFAALTVTANAAQQLARNSSGVIGGIIAGPAAVAYFALAESFTQKLQVLGKPIGQASMPTASQLHAEKQTAELQAMTKQNLCMLFALAFAFVVVMLVFGLEFVTHWIGEEFATRSYPLICILSTALIVSLPSSSVTQILQGMGHVGFVARTSVIEGISVVLMGVPLTYVWGMAGLASTMLVTTTIFQGVILGSYLLRMLGLPLSRFLRDCLVPALVSAILPLTGAVCLHIQASGGLIETAFKMCLVMGIAGISSFVICLSPESREIATRAILGKRAGQLVLRFVGRKS